MVWKTIISGSTGNANVWGGNDLNKVSNLFNGQLNVDSVDINSPWTFENFKLRINNPTQSAYYTIATQPITSLRTITLPLLTGDDQLTCDSNTTTLSNKTISGLNNTIINIPKTAIQGNTLVYNDQPNLYGTFAQTFQSSNLKLLNPAQTFNYIIAGSAITADRTLTLPLLTGSDTLVAAALAQSLTNKTIDLASNTVTSTSGVAGDLAKHDGTSFKRFGKGTANQVLAVNAGGTDLTWVTSSAAFTASSTDTLTNKSISGSTNTLTNIPKSAIPAATVYTDQSNTFGLFDQLFKTSRLKLQNPAATFNYILATSAISADRTVTLPLLTGNDQVTMDAFTTTLTNKTMSGSSNTFTNIPKTALPSATVFTDQSNTFGLFDQIYPTSRIKIQNPAATFNYILATSAITADRTVTFPLLTGNDQVTMDAFSTTLTNKTINATNNTINDTSIATGDILKSSGTKFVRFAMGTANQVLTVNAGGTDLAWATQAGGGNVSTTSSNTYGDFDQIIRSSRLKITNPANTFNYAIVGSAITAARNVTLPLLTGDDTLVTLAMTQTLTNKTLTTPVISSISNTGTVTLPTATDTLVGRATTDTLTNKTMDYNSNTFQNFPGGISVLPDSGNKVGYFLGGTPAASGSSGSGLWNGITLLGTSTLNVVDATATTGVVTKFAPAQSNGSFSGFRMPNNYTRRDYSPVFKFKFAIGATTSRRVYFGFATTATNLPTGTDSVLASSESGFLFGYRSTADSNFMIFNNDASGAMVATSTGTAVDTALHTVVLTADNTNTRFQWSIDGGATTNVSTRIPAATTQMNTYVQIENLSTGGPSIMLAWAQIVQTQ